MARKLDGGKNHERIASTPGGDHTDGAGRPTLDRRSLLRLGSASLVGSALTTGALTSSAAAATTRSGIGFDRVVDAVDDLGLDPNGQRPVTNTLNGVESGTLVQFPPGDYLFDGEVAISNGTYGFESIGDGPARIVVAQGYDNWLLNGHGMGGLYLSGFEVDQTADHTIGCLRLIGDRVHIQDIEFVGRADIWDQGAENMLNCSIEAPDGYGEVRNVVHTEGHWARYGPGAAGRIGIYTGARHTGTLKIVDCDLREFGNNALYCSRNYGDVQVEDCYFENNNAAQIRIGGEGSYAENCTIVTDPALYTGPRTYEDESFHHRAIVIEERFDTGSIQYQKPAGAEIRNCTIRIEDNPANGAAIHRYGNGRALRIENTTVEYNNGNYPAAIMVDTGGFGINPDADDPRGVELIDSVVYGTGDVDTAIRIRGSDESLISNSIVYFEDGSQDGVRIEDANRCVIEDSTISVPGDATSFRNADVETVNLSTEPPASLDPGESDDEPAPEFDHQLRIVADEDEPPFEYSLTVDGEIELVTTGNYPANPDGETVTDHGDGTMTVDGVVAGYDGDDTRWGGDTFAFTGDIIAFEMDGSGTVSIDGEAVDPIDLVDGDQPEDDGTVNQLRIIADDDADAFEYEFTVTGDLALVTEGDYPANPDGDRVIENDDGTMTAEGVVAGYTGDDARWGGDTFSFTGSLESFVKAGPGTVLLNGRVIDPMEYTVVEERFLTIRAALHAAPLAYEVKVAGSVEAVRYGSLIDDGNFNRERETVSVDDDGMYRIEGVLSGGSVATYKIDGSIEGMRLDGPGTAHLDNELVDASDYGLLDQLTIVGTGTVSNYEFTIDGEISVDPNGPSEAANNISGSTAEGAITHNAVSFRFDGTVTSFSLEGDAGIYLNGRQVDPQRLTEDASPFLENWIVVDGSRSLTEYTIGVSGRILKAPDLGPVEASDTVEGGVAIGTVAYNSDGYRFSGDLNDLWVNGDAEVRFGS